MWCARESADGLGQPLLPEKFVADQPVADVVRVVEVARVVVEPVHPDVVQQAARPHCVNVNCVNVN